MNKSTNQKAIKKLCLLGMLTAITAILSIYCTFRIGNIIKIPFKFVSVFITGALLGPFAGATAAACGDLLNSFLVPVGEWIPMITILEFIVGLIYGIFFYKLPFSGKTYILRVFLCVIINFAIDITITSLILTLYGYFPSFSVAVTARLAAAIIKAITQFLFLLTGMKLLPKLNKLI